MPYFGVHIINTNSGHFGVVLREGSVRTLNSHHIFDTFDEAYKTAKVWAFGNRDLVDETIHH